MRLLLLSIVMLLSGCASPAVVQNPYVRTAVTPVDRLALAPGSGALGEAVAAALTARGFYVMPADEVAVLMRQGGAGTLNAPVLGGLGFLVPPNIHGVLEVKGDAPGEAPVSARATVLRVPDGARIAESRWRNRFGWLERQYHRAESGDIAQDLAAQIAVRLRG